MATESLTGLDDKRLLQLLNEGSREAFDNLYNRYWKQVLNLAYKRVGDADAAQDIAQDVFFQLWTRATESAIENFGAYLFVSVRNAVFRYFEKQSKYASLSDVAHEIETLHERPDSNVLYAEFLHAFEKLVHSLPEQQRIIFRMRYDEGLSTQEIADELQLSVKTVRNHLGRALATLRECLLVAHMLIFLLGK
jgi:RNA polymerase sigma-70 factor (ECF subfamily)